MKYELVCFDLDGTLVDSTRDIRAALVHALAAVPPADVRLDEHALGCAGLGLPLDEFYALARPAPHPAADDAGRQRFIDAYRSYYHAHLLDQTAPFPGVAATLELVKPLRAAGMRTAVATTKKTLTAERVLGGLGLAHHFDLILGTEAPMPHKPAPDLLLACARRLERDPARGLMIGDTERDVLAGRAAGMRTCGVSYGVLGAEGLTPHAPDFLIDRFADLWPLLAG
ncbi:MAG TPA: HAD-IA family hydrolase [Polyangia bacterium]|nr:HAD-IA family hydrolase [Polyangia bacterium]